MKDLKENISSAFGEHGDSWLKQLPSTIEHLIKYWHLKDLQPNERMTWSYIAKATRDDKPVILKITCDNSAFINERHALQYFHHQGAIALTDFSTDNKALLLQQAIPGTPLKTLRSIDIDNAMTQYAIVIEKLTASCMPSFHLFERMGQWCESIDYANDSRIPPLLLAKAISLKNHLISTATQEVILHGDLHLNNIISHEDHWLAIDPKGVIGEIPFEVAKFDFIDSIELMEPNKCVSLVSERVKILGDKLDLDTERLMNWVFVRHILAACWFIEDDLDPTPSIIMATIVNKSL
jgi:streptomycin 6-kinase